MCTGGHVRQKLMLRTSLVDIAHSIKRLAGCSECVKHGTGSLINLLLEKSQRVWLSHTCLDPISLSSCSFAMPTAPRAAAQQSFKDLQGLPPPGPPPWQVSVQQSAIQVLECIREYKEGKTVLKVKYEGQDCVLKVFGYMKPADPKETYKDFGFYQGDGTGFYNELTAYRRLDEAGFCGRRVVPPLLGKIDSVDPKAYGKWLKKYKGHNQPPRALLLKYMQGRELDVPSHTDQVAKHLISGLEGIHKAGVVWNSVNSRNIMIGVTHPVTFLDFESSLTFPRASEKNKWKLEEWKRWNALRDYNRVTESQSLGDLLYQIGEMKKIEEEELARAKSKASASGASERGSSKTTAPAKQASGCPKPNKPGSSSKRAKASSKEPAEVKVAKSGPSKKPKTG